MSDALTGIRKSLNSILSIRDKVAIIHAVFQVTRTWQGEEVGSGEYTDDTVRIYPTPRLKEYGHDVRISEGGSIKQGDIILKGLSKENYEETDLECTTLSPNVEKFWLIDDKEYTTINVKERMLTFDVQLRKRSG